MESDESIAVEVLLNPGPEADVDAAREKVASYLTASGMTVVAEGRRSLSVEATAEQFETMFGCSIVDKREAPSGASDFGPVAQPAVGTDSEPSIPDEIQKEVESVYIQTPPLMF